MYSVKKEKKTLNNKYVYNVVFVIFIFFIFIIGSTYFYDTTHNRNSHYSGDCLIDLATNYQSHNCLDN